MQLRQSNVALRIFGDDLVPEEVSALLGCQPTRSYRKGQVRAPNVLAKTGTWLLEVTDTEPGNIEAQVSEVLGQVTANLEVWRQLGQRFEVDIYCGAFMQTSNDGIELSSHALLRLGQRGIGLGLDVYAPSADDA
jgi:hypothetical protein